ncbi:MAG: hypothetical protein SFT81_04520 [Candidatus Caenarcaniphilales bacterium]|nr:hypothetical protein [Candidatus Caenarcaniphilales bacterium]
MKHDLTKPESCNPKIIDDRTCVGLWQRTPYSLAECEDKYLPDPEGSN